MRCVKERAANVGFCVGSVLKAWCGPDNLTKVTCILIGLTIYVQLDSVDFEVLEMHLNTQGA